MANRVTFVAGGAALSLPTMRDPLDETLQEVWDGTAGHRGLDRLILTNPGNAMAFAKLFWTADEAPTLSTDVPDYVVGIPAGETLEVGLENITVQRLWVAATSQSGAGAGAPNQDLVGALLW